MWKCAYFKRNRVLKNMKLSLDPWQKEFLETKGDKILCCGRQVGKSEICSMDAAEYAVANPNSKPIVMIAPTERQAYGLFSKTLNYLADNYPKLIRTGKDRPTKERIKLKSGVEIYCLPVGKDGLGIRFLTIGRLYVDEASRVPENVWTAIEPALLTTGGDEILLSTPFGAQGMFYDIFKNKDNAFESFTRFSIDSEKVIQDRLVCETWLQIQRDKALMKLDQAKKRMSKREYAQEFMGQFVEDLHRWFSDELIANTCTLKREDGIRPGSDYFMGCDIARMGEDEGTFEIVRKINKDNYVQVENIVTTKKLTTETYRNIKSLEQKYIFQKIYIDAGAGSLGVAIFDMCLDDDMLKRKVVAINNADRPLDHDKEKGKRTKILKEDLYDNLRALMEQGKIKLLDDEDLIESLRSVQYEYLMKEGEPTRLRIFGDYTHIAEGLIRAAWSSKSKELNIWIKSF